MLREAQEGRHVILPSSLYTPLEKLFNTSLGYPKHYQKIPKKFSDKTSDIMCYGPLWGRRETGVDAQGLRGHHCLLV